jgi:RNA polymerase sigma-70 factor, ECF subfamily
MAEATTEMQDEVALVQAARAGDRFAFGQLYQRYGRMVHGILLSRVPNGAVDDLVQDVFLKAMVQLHHLRDDDKFGGWIATIARNRANDHFRRTRETDEIPEDIGVRENASVELEAKAALRTLQDLPDTYRETLTLRLVEGMTGPEIAQRTGLTADSVRVNLHRGMKLLRERLERRP